MWLAALAGMIFLIAVLWLQWRLRTIRRDRLRDLELRPNCLLTRHPLIFVASRRSLFRIFEPWNEIPGFLREHGYEVFVLEPQFSRLALRKKSVITQIQAALNALAQGESGPLSRFHLIAESSLEAEWIRLAETSDRRIASLSLAVREAARSPYARSVRDQTTALKPLAASIEELPLDNLAPLLRQSRGWNRIAVLLLWGHNFLVRLRHLHIGPLDPIAVGQILTSNWLIENRFLNHVIELAERDSQFSI